MLKSLLEIFSLLCFYSPNNVLGLMKLYQEITALFWILWVDKHSLTGTLNSVYWLLFGLLC